MKKKCHGIYTQMTAVRKEKIGKRLAENSKMLTVTVPAEQ